MTLHMRCHQGEIHIEVERISKEVGHLKQELIHMYNRIPNEYQDGWIKIRDLNVDILESLLKVVKKQNMDILQLNVLLDQCVEPKDNPTFQYVIHNKCGKSMEMRMKNVTIENPGYLINYIEIRCVPCKTEWMRWRKNVLEADEHY